MPTSSGRPLLALQWAPGPVLFAALRTALDGGPALLPLAPGLSASARERLLRALRPAELVTPDERRTLADAEPVGDDVALVVATSGSTGTPKGVELTASALQASARASLRRLEAPADDRWLCCLPTSHVGGLQVLVRSLLLGTDPLIVPRFDLDGVASAPRGLSVALVPTMLRRLLDARADLARFRVVLLGGAAAPSALLAQAAARGARVVTTYGMTETAGGCVYDGIPLDGVQVDIRARRIAVRGPVLCRGYRGHRRAERIDGWLQTNDLGRWTADGRLEVLGRDDDVIVTGGENVVAGRVAEILATHPGVAEAAVVGRTDPHWGQRIVAVVVPADAASPPDLAELGRFVRARAAAFEAPRELVVVERLPLLASGKLDRLALEQPAG